MARINSTKKATVTAAKKAAKAAPKASKVESVPGHPHVKVVTGVGTGPKTIAQVTSANRGHDTIAILNDGSTHTVTDYTAKGVSVKAGMDFERTKTTYLALLRGEKEAAKAPKPVGHLAKGLDGRSAPHSAKAVADNHAAAKKAAAKPAKEAKKAERKAARAEKAAPKADDNRKITIVDKKFTFGGDGTARRASWDACKASKTVAEFIGKGGKAKYLPRWVASGAVKLA